MRTAATALLLLCLPAALAQDPGVVEDVPYLVSPQVTVDEMLRLAQVVPGDRVYDLGSGDGRVVITAAVKFGARGVGVEIDAARVAESRANAARAGVDERVKFLQQDLFTVDLAPASVITLYLAPHLNLRLRPKLEQLRPGTRIVSHASDLGDWKPDRQTAVRKNVYLWIVPARVAGRWRVEGRTALLGRTLDLEFRQRRQEISAAAWLDGEAAQVWDARLEGDRLSFVIVEAGDKTEPVGLYFEGVAAGDRIEGDVRRDVGIARRSARWQAQRIAP